MTNEETLAVIDNKLGSRRTSAALISRLLSQRQKLVQAAPVQQQAPSEKLTLLQQYASTLPSPDREIWLEVDRLEREARAARKPMALTRDLVKDLNADREVRDYLARHSGEAPEGYVPPVSNGQGTDF